MRVPPIVAALTGVVALAFADASIVALALPPIYARFDTTIVGVSWVLTGYAVAVTGAALAVVAARRWLRPEPLTMVGLTLFGAGSAWCGAAGSLSSLLVGRVAQGVGAAALLSGALELLCAHLGRERGRRLWSGAATAGLAAGPALGGALTQAFDWRVIFLGQVPVAALVLVVLAFRRAPVVRPPDEPADRGAIWANLGYVTLFAGLVGALFLGVLLLVEIWRFSPLGAALVMMALPAGTVLAGRVTAGAGPAVRIIAGTVGLSTGLLALALLPGANAAWAAVALFLCGAGSGTVVRVLAAVPATGSLVRAGAAVVAAKHAGLVLGLVVIAPLLAGSLEDGGRRALVAGTGVMLDARMPVQEKVRLALAMRDTFAAAPRGAVPDVAAAVGATESSDAAGSVVDEVDARLSAVLTRAFRPAFAVAAGLAFLTVLAGFAVRPGWVWTAGVGRGRQSGFAVRDGPRSRGAWGARAALAGLLLLGAGTVAVEVTAGAREVGRYAETEPCAAPADPYPGSGMDAVVQRVAYGALHGAACELGLSRERFVLALAGQPGFAGVRWDRSTVERVVRAAVDRALDDVDQRGDLPEWTVALVRETVRTMPLEEILRVIGFS